MKIMIKIKNGCMEVAWVPRVAADLARFWVLLPVASSVVSVGCDLFAVFATRKRRRFRGLQLVCTLVARVFWLQAASVPRVTQKHRIFLRGETDANCAKGTGSS